MRVHLTEQLAARRPDIGQDERAGARLSIQALSSQKRDEVTAFKVDSVNSSEMLPGGAPIVDHLAAYISTNPGYHSIAQTVESIRNMRSPTPELHSEVEVRELVLGLSSVEEMRDATEWVKEKRESTAKKCAGISVLAADTESVTIKARGAAATQEQFFEALGEDVQSVRFSLAGHGDKKAIQCPVLFMIGGISWQLHLLLHLEYKGTDIVFFKGSLPVFTYRRLLEQFTTAVGVDITTDYQDFFRIIEKLYGNSDVPPVAPLELSRIAMLAGSDHPQTGLVSLVWVWLGGVLVKHYKCSMGDGKWGRRFNDLPLGLQLYLEGDIQQPAAVATLMLMVITINLFPDPVTVFNLNNMGPQDLMGYWSQTVLERLSHDPSSWGPRCPPATPHTDRKSLIRDMGLPDMGYEVLKLCPDWPSITNGGVRYSQEAMEFLERIYPTLRAYDPKTWPAYSREELRSKTSQLRSSTRNRPVGQIHVNTVGRQPPEQSWVELPVEQLSYKRLREEKARLGMATNRSMIDLYIRHDPQRARELLDYWEEKPERVKDLMGADRYLPTVRDVRKFLQAIDLAPKRQSDWVDPLGEQQLDVLKALNLAKHNERAEAADRREIERRLARLEGHKSAKEFGRVEKAGRLHGNHPLVRGTAPRDSNLVPGETSRRRNRRGRRKMTTKDKLHHLKALGLLELPSEMLKQSDPCEIMKQRFEEASRRRSGIIEEVTEEVIEEEWIEERHVSATTTSGALQALEAAERVNRTVTHRESPENLEVQVTTSPRPDSKPALPPDYRIPRRIVVEKDPEHDQNLKHDQDLRHDQDQRRDWDSDRERDQRRDRDPQHARDQRRDRDSERERNSRSERDSDRERSLRRGRDPRRDWEDEQRWERDPRRGRDYEQRRERDPRLEWEYDREQEEGWAYDRERESERDLEWRRKREERERERKREQDREQEKKREQDREQERKREQDREQERKRERKREQEREQEQKRKQEEESKKNQEREEEKRREIEQSKQIESELRLKRNLEKVKADGEKRHQQSAKLFQEIEELKKKEKELLEARAKKICELTEEKKRREKENAKREKEIEELMKQKKDLSRKKEEAGTKKDKIAQMQKAIEEIAKTDSADELMAICHAILSKKQKEATRENRLPETVRPWPNSPQPSISSRTSTPRTSPNPSPVKSTTSDKKETPKTSLSERVATMLQPRVNLRLPLKFPPPSPKASPEKTKKTLEDTGKPSSEKKTPKDTGKPSSEEKTPLTVEEEIDLILRDEDYDLLRETSPPRKESTNKPSVLKKPEDTVKPKSVFKPAAKIKFDLKVSSSDATKSNLKSSDNAPPKLLPGKRKRDCSLGRKQPKKMTK
jgi:hypothetical protein